MPTMRVGSIDSFIAECQAKGLVVSEASRPVRAPALAGGVSEKDFQAEVIRLAKRHGWMIYHTFDSRRSERGFPDLVMVRGGQLLFAELKAEDGTLSQAQRDWIDALNGAGVVACVWRPRDWDAITRELTEAE